jgi:hypothetical protein
MAVEASNANISRCGLCGRTYEIVLEILPVHEPPLSARGNVSTDKNGNCLGSHGEPVYD